MLRNLIEGVDIACKHVRMAVYRMPVNILSLTFTTLWANSADGILMIFSYFSQKTKFDISCKLNLHEMPKSVFYEKQDFNMSSIEKFYLQVKLKIGKNFR